MSAQSRHPFVLAAYGIALLINVTVVEGPNSAYKLISRGVHRVLDWLFVVGLFAGAFLLDIDQSTRTTLFGVGLAIVVIALTTNYTKKVFGRS